MNCAPALASTVLVPADHLLLTRSEIAAALARSKLPAVYAKTSGERLYADREGCSVRKVNMTISLAFLAPNLVKAAIDGRLPYGMGVVRLSDLPAEWSHQHLMLGFNT
jgi:site-specific DNA recombinase